MWLITAARTHLGRRRPPAHGRGAHSSSACRATRSPFSPKRPAACSGDDPGERGGSSGRGVYESRKNSEERCRSPPPPSSLLAAFLLADPLYLVFSLFFFSLTHLPPLFPSQADFSLRIRVRKRKEGKVSRRRLTGESRSGELAGQVKTNVSRGALK